MKILVVEDDIKTASYLKKGFTEQGFSVDVCHDGMTALSLAQERSYDLYVFDVMLPFMSGLEVLKTLRDSGNAVHSVLLTAKDQLKDRIEGLDVGADAYLVKPFSFSELLAIVRSMQRRILSSSTTTPNNTLIQLDDLSIDLMAHVATRAGQRLDLTPIEFRLLSFLARHAGEVISRTVIMEQVWDIHFDCNTNVVDVHIRRLRAKMDDPFEFPLIHTIRGVGYALKRYA